MIHMNHRSITHSIYKIRLYWQTKCVHHNTHPNRTELIQALPKILNKKGKHTKKNKTKQNKKQETMTKNIHVVQTLWNHTEVPSHNGSK